eukprot:601059-Amphidinium_carterae.1
MTLNCPGARPPPPSTPFTYITTITLPLACHLHPFHASLHSPHHIPFTLHFIAATPSQPHHHGRVPESTTSTDTQVPQRQNSLHNLH